MKSDSSRRLTAIPSVLVLGSLYVADFCVLLTAMAIYKKGDISLFFFLPSHAGIVFLFAVLGLITSALVIMLLLRKGVPAGSYRFAHLLFLNVWSVLLMFGVAEIVIRLSVVRTPAGPMFANTLLLPRSWEDFAVRNRAILAKASTYGSYLVFDRMLGWTVGRSRSSSDGLYFSSVEGIRSPRAGMTFGDAPEKQRIAIIGDSFTFGLEVHYEQTWGHQLELQLGSEYQVLNFGVDGYGVDQAYLRYQRDVLPWRPEIVLLGIINDDVARTMGVYGFLKFIDSEMPFPKPRFVIRNNALSVVNLPLPTPDSTLGIKSIRELPFIEYDASFQRAEWEWRFYHYAYSIRFLLSRFPRWPLSGPHVSNEETRSINGELFRSFMRLAREQGSIPIVVYFPSKSDFESTSTRIGKEILQANGIPYLDMTSCVTKIESAERFVIRHYSPATNAAIANCLRAPVREALRS